MTRINLMVSSKILRGPSSLDMLRGFVIGALVGMFLSALMLVLSTKTAHAFLMAETEPGIAQVRSAQDKGLLITQMHDWKNSKTKKSFVYFCVAEKSKTPNKNADQRCFYGLKSDFAQLKKGQTLLGIEYGMQGRILNTSRVPFAKNKYFHMALVIKST